MNEQDSDIPQDHMSIWRDLSTMAPSEMEADARQRIGSTVKAAASAVHHRNRRNRMIRFGGLLAAAVTISLIAGGALGHKLGAEDRSPAITTQENGEEYLFLLHETPSTTAAVRDEGIESTVSEYASWAGDLARQGRLVAAEKLNRGTRWAGTDHERTSAISGYFVVRAKDLEAALRTARESPHVRRGGVIEVRAVDNGV